MPTIEPVDFDPFSTGLRQPIPNEGRALLGAIAGGESPGYNTMYGGGQFTGFADHPRQNIPITSGPNRGKTSSAAGLYQFLAPTWDEVRKEANLPDFSPENQDYGAWFLANKVYAQKTGRDLLKDLQDAKGDTGRINTIGRYLAGTWTSIPGGIEPNSQTGSFGQRYASGLGPSDFSSQSRPKLIPVDHDPFATANLPDTGGRFADSAGENFRVAREGMSEPPQGFTDRLAAMWENPPRDRLSMIRIAKDLYTAARTLGEGIAGNVPMYDETGNLNPDVLGSAINVAAAAPMRMAPGGVFGASVGKGIPRVVEPPPMAPPTLAQTKAAGSAGYESPEVANLAVAPAAIREWAQGIRTGVTEKNYPSEIVAPKTHATLKQFDNPPEGSTVTGSSLNDLRVNLRHIADERSDGVMTPDALAATRAMKSLDNLVPSLKPEDVVSGDAAAAASKLDWARGNWNAYRQARSIDKKTVSAENRAAASNSGMNVANTIRQRLATVLNDEGQMAGFKPAEQAMIREIVHGRPSDKSVRFAANLLGGGGGLGAVVAATAGGLATGGPGAALPLAGFALKALENHMTVQQAQKLSQMILSRSPLANAARDLEKRMIEYSLMQTPKNRAYLTLAARNLSNNLKDAGINLAPAEIVRALTGGARQAAADKDEQE